MAIFLLTDSDDEEEEDDVKTGFKPQVILEPKVCVLHVSVTLLRKLSCTRESVNEWINILSEDESIYKSTCLT